MSKMPVVTQVSIIGSVPQLTVLFLLIGGGFLWAGTFGAWSGGVLYFVLRFSLRELPHAHRKGIRFVNREQFKEAAQCFLDSYEFFEKRRWLDRYRSILMLCPSRISYREMALANSAFCYAQTGDGENARLYYEKCLEHFPDSRLASVALRLMDAAGGSRSK